MDKSPNLNKNRIQYYILEKLEMKDSVKNMIITSQNEYTIKHMELFTLSISFNTK